MSFLESGTQPLVPCVEFGEHHFLAFTGLAILVSAELDRGQPNSIAEGNLLVSKSVLNEPCNQCTHLRVLCHPIGPFGCKHLRTWLLISWRLHRRL